MPSGQQPCDVLTDEEVKRFWADGYLLLKGILSRAEAENYRQVILDLIPANLTIPDGWSHASGRIKPFVSPGNHTFDTPELLPLWANERLYAAVAQLAGTPRLRVGDGSLGITLRNTGLPGESLSQPLHLDASVPQDADNFLFTPEEVQFGGCFYFTDVEPDGGGIHVVPGGPRLVEAEARCSPRGRQLHQKWQRITDLESVEVTGSAGDFALLHHLMPHGASHNRRAMARVAQFLRFVREDNPYGYGTRPAGEYGPAQLAVMSPLCRKLLGLDPWPIQVGIK